MFVQGLRVDLTCTREGVFGFGVIRCGRSLTPRVFARGSVSVGFLRAICVFVC